MSQEKHPIDSLFRSLNEETSEVPAHIWTNVHEQIQRKPGRNRLFWFLPFFISGLLLAGLLIDFSGSKATKETPPSNDQTAVAEMETPTFPTPKETDSPASSSEKDVSKADMISVTADPADEFEQPAATGKTNNTKITQTPDSQVFNPDFTIRSENDSRRGDPAEKEVIPPLNQSFAALPALYGSNLSSIAFEQTYPSIIETDINKDCYSFAALENDIFLDIYFAPEYAFREMEPLTTEADNYIQERENTESFNYAFSAGVRASYIFHSGLAVRAGINYTQIAEVFDYVNANTKRTITEIITDPNGNPIDTTTTMQTGTRVKTTYNRLHLLDVPLALGYEFGGDKWRFSLTGGAAINLLFLKKGDMLSPSLNPVSFSSSDDNPYPVFKETVGLSVIGGIGAYYQLSENMYVMCEPEIRYYVNPFTVESYSIEQTYWNAGLAIGLRIKI